MTAERTSGTPLRAAIVGAGLMGRWHADAVRRLGHVVAAIIDPDASRAAALASQHAGVEVLGSLQESQATLDVVHVCTPLDTHQTIIEAALTRGYHVIAEKPLAPSADVTRRLLRVAAERGRVLVPVHQFLFQRGVLHAAALLPSIGPVLHFEAAVCTAGADGLSSDGRDRIAVEVLPHPLSLVSRLVSPAITDAGWHVRRTQPGELRVDGVVAGSTVSLLVSTGGRPTVNTVRLIGTQGTVQIDLFHGFAVHQRGPATRTGKVVQPFVSGGAVVAAAAANLVRRSAEREPAYPGLRELIRRVYAAVVGATATPVSPEETLNVAIARDQIVGEMAGA